MLSKNPLNADTLPETAIAELGRRAKIPDSEFFRFVCGVGPIKLFPLIASTDLDRLSPDAAREHDEIRRDALRLQRRLRLLERHRPKGDLNERITKLEIAGLKESATDPRLVAAAIAGDTLDAQLLLAGYVFAWILRGFRASA